MPVADEQEADQAKLGKNRYDNAGLKEAVVGIERQFAVTYPSVDGSMGDEAGPGFDHRFQDRMAGVNGEGRIAEGRFRR